MREARKQPRLALRGDQLAAANAEGAFVAEDAAVAKQRERVEGVRLTRRHTRRDFAGPGDRADPPAGGDPAQAAEVGDQERPAGKRLNRGWEHPRAGRRPAVTGEAAEARAGDGRDDVAVRTDAPHP